VGDEAAVALVDAPALRQLSLLGLGDCDITDEGVAALARAPGLARISRLALGGPDLGPASARALLDSPYAGSLRVLSLQAAVPDPRLRQALQRRFGCCPTCWPSRGGPQRAGRA
jgi:Mrp family chromosome partitioning ATPase